MKLSKLILVWCVVALIGSLHTTTAQSVPFQEARNEVRDRYEYERADGTHALSKQFRRWEWFWESRVGSDGSMPSSEVYRSAAILHESSLKKGDALQSIARWTEVGPVAPANFTNPNGWFGIGRINCIAFSYQNASSMWLGSAAGGVWRTTNGGQQWIEVPIAGYPIFGVSDIAVSPQDDKIIYIATGDANGSVAGTITGFPSFSFGVLKSTNGGQTWTATGFASTTDRQQVIGRLWVDPRDARTVVAATSNGIRRTTDGGATWQFVSGTIHMRDLVQHPTNPNVLYAASFNFEGAIQVFRSTNAGAQWTLTETFTNAVRGRLAVSAHAPNLVYLLTSAPRPFGLGGVFYSTNQGVAWTQLETTRNLLGWSSTGDDWDRGGQGWYDLAMTVSPTNSQRVTVGGVNNWRSTNGGASWNIATEQRGRDAPFVHADQHFLAYHPLNGRLYACNDGGISVSTNDGVHWQDISTGLRIQQFYAMDVSQTVPTTLIAGAQDNATYIKKESGGAHVIGGDGMECLIDWSNANNMYASIYNGQLYRSTTGGQNFSIMSRSNERGEPGAWVTPMVMSAINPNVLFVGYRNVWRSANQGTTWNRISNFSVSAESTLRKLAVSPTSEDHIYASFSSSLFRTTNRGTTWNQVRDIGSYVSSITVDPDNPNKAYVTFGAFDARYRVAVIEDGEVRDISGTGLPNVPANTILVHNSVAKRLIVGTDIGVYFRDGENGAWEPFGTNMPTTIVTDLVMVNSTNMLRASTYGRGIWEVDASQCQAAVPEINVSPSSSTAICTGDTLTLTAPAGYYRYRWSNGDTNRVLRLASGSQSGDYAVNVTDQKGCRATSNVITVSILPAPPRPLVLVRGDTLRSTAVGGIVRYQWYRGLRGSTAESAISGATQREYVPETSDLYSVRVYNASNCSNHSEAVQATLTSISVSSSAASDVRVVPNPATSLTRISWDGLSVNAQQVSVHSLDGRTVINAEVQPGESSLTLDVASIARGVYIVRLQSTHGVHSIPFVRE